MVEGKSLNLHLCNPYGFSRVPQPCSLLSLPVETFEMANLHIFDVHMGTLIICSTLITMLI